MEPRAPTDPSAPAGSAQNPIPAPVISIQSRPSAFSLTEASLGFAASNPAMRSRMDALLKEVRCAASRAEPVCPHPCSC